MLKTGRQNCRGHRVPKWHVVMFGRLHEQLLLRDLDPGPAALSPAPPVLERSFLVDDVDTKFVVVVEKNCPAFVVKFDLVVDTCREVRVVF